MQTDNKTRIAFAYLRLSREESKNGSESSSIQNQRVIIQDFCERNGITLVREFVDDGWSGGSFERPAFQEMISQLRKGLANTVVTKDLSRFGREMNGASDYAEQILPEMGVQLVTVVDNFNTEDAFVYAPFMYAMNDVYIRDGSKKIKEVLKNKREHGQYCACPPYGYKKSNTDKNRLVPDEITAPVVKRIFTAAANGDSSRKIAMDLNRDGVIPPLKYRVLYRDDFSEAGAARASDLWNYTTVKRILKNPVYLGHTILGKTKKVSLKSKKKVTIPKKEWAITQSTHEPIISEAVFEQAKINMGKGTMKHEGYDNVRKSIFSGIVYCKKCGHALCSAGTVYKGEREKYWYLSCINKRKDITEPCSGTRIRYADLLEVVRQDLNELLALSDEEVKEIASELIRRENAKSGVVNSAVQKRKLNERLDTINRIITKLYTDNAEGRLSDERLFAMVSEHEKEASQIKATLAQAEAANHEEKIKDSFERFFAAAKRFSSIETLDRETLTTFIEKIEIGEKILPPGTKMVTHRNQSYSQEIKIYYKFIGNIADEEQRQIG